MVGGYRRLAREIEMAIVFTYLQSWPQSPRNSATLIDRHGATLMTYSKVHTCAWEAVEGSLKPGDGFHVAEVDVGHARVSLGLMICFDREFPESARILMLGGAELILIPNACDMVRELDGIRLAQLRARAFENMVLLAMANYAAPHTGGCSAAVNADGSLALLAGEEEGDQSRSYRRREVWGNAYRRPELYQALSHGACG